jgi:3-methyl-2-oxobutanoate hydroxymethyltransferase
MSSHTSLPAHLTIPEIAARKASAGRGAPLTMITAYDVVSARLADRAGAELLLVGDSVGMVMLGRENTLTVTVDEIIHHARAVTVARPRAVVVGDMPFLSYHISVSEAVRNAGRLLSEGGCQAVKVEGGRRCLPTVERLLCADIPVMGHLGLTPQSVHRMGGFRVQARQAEAAEALMGEARLLAEAGVFAIVLEGIPAEVARIVTEAIAVPTIGIGAGPHCDGQVLVWHDLLGLTEGLAPKFVRRYADLGSLIVDALSRFVNDVRTGDFPSSGESYHASAEVATALRERSNHTDPARPKEGTGK